MSASTRPAKEPAPRTRDDGWTPDRRRTFLEALAAGQNVDAACAHVGLSRVGAYALRNRDPAFALGWSGALLRGRDALVEILTSRAIDGQVETWTRPDGTEGSRRRYDNRLAMALLARLDRLSEHKSCRAWIEQPDEDAARSVSDDFGGFLDLIEQDKADASSVARFVDAQLCKVSKLCSLDRWNTIVRASRLGVEDPNEALDAIRENDRAHREAAQAAEQARDSDEDQDFDAEDDDEAEIDGEDANVTWFELSNSEWRTSLPPPADFDGYEVGRFGQPRYWRELTDAELEAARAGAAAEREFCRALATASQPSAQSPADPESPLGGNRPEAEEMVHVMRYTPVRRPRADWVV